MGALEVGLSSGRQVNLNNINEDAEVLSNLLLIVKHHKQHDVDEVRNLE